MKRIPILIDTDPGVDDFFCLALAIANRDKFDIRAVTTIGGNNWTEVTTRNALDILDWLGCDSPVAAGAKSYLREPFAPPVAKFHGENGLGNLEIPHTDRKAVDLVGCEMIYKAAKEAGGELIVVTVGPETNLALALMNHPDLPSLIKKIVVMGGSTSFGNITPHAEANIAHDRFAADVVFNSGVPIDMIGLNLTHTCCISADEFEALATEARPEVKAFMKGLVEFRNGEPMHDAIALATLVDESITEWQDCRISIELADAEKLGKTHILPQEEGIKHRVAVKMDLNSYRKIFADMANYYK